jgi:hypothetical protein
MGTASPSSEVSADTVTVRDTNKQTADKGRPLELLVSMIKEDLGRSTPWRTIKTFMNRKTRRISPLLSTL